MCHSTSRHSRVPSLSLSLEPITLPRRSYHVNQRPCSGMQAWTLAGVVGCASAATTSAGCASATSSATTSAGPASALRFFRPADAASACDGNVQKGWCEGAQSAPARRRRPIPAVGPGRAPRTRSRAPRSASPPFYTPSTTPPPTSARAGPTAPAWQHQSGGVHH
eukprot:5773937-Prymnesium_polylepis.1